MTATHTTLTIGDKIHGVTPTGTIIRTGTYKGFQDRASQTTTTGREYEALVRWDGDNYDSPVSFDRLIPAGACDYCFATDGHHVQCPRYGLTRDQAVRDAALATRAYQTNPTTDLFTTMLNAIDRAHDLGATDDDIITATLNH
jgi:hypothetical protein